MESWSVLPENSLTAAGPDSESFLRLGINSFRNAARHLNELPYGRNADRANYRLVLAEHRGTCSTKHALLAAVAIEQGLPVSLTIGIYDMSEANTPGVGRVLAAHGLVSIPEAHCYLSYAGQRVDITRSGISPQEMIARFHDEWTIEPSQIGTHKIALHQQFLRGWLTKERQLALSYEQLWRIREECILALDATQSAEIGHIPRLELVQGAACETIPAYVRSNPHLVVSMLYLDFDLYEPTKVALELFLPRMPRGAVLAFDELAHAAWPGETQAVLDTVGLRSLKIRRFPFVPQLSYAVLD